MSATSWLRLLLLAGLCGLAQSKLGCVRAKGTVLCNEKPYEGAKVRLYDIDEIQLGPLTKLMRLLNPDDLMDVTMSDKEGTYELSGCASDFDWIVGDNDIDPFIFISHRCNGKSETVLVEVTMENNNGYVAEFTPPMLDLVRHGDELILE